MRMGKVSVFLRKQNPGADPPPHRCSRRFAERAVAAFPLSIKFISKDSLQLLTEEAWSALRRRLRPGYAGVVERSVPRPELCSPNENLDLSYPEPMRVSVHSGHPGFHSLREQARREDELAGAVVAEVLAEMLPDAL